MDQLNSLYTSINTRFLRNLPAEIILHLSAYLLPVGVFFLIIYRIQVPVDILLMVARAGIFIFIVDLPILWALQRSHKPSIIWTLLVFAIVFGLGLKLLWQNEGDLFLNQGTYSTIGGLLPWSDASGYFADARTFLYGSAISAYSSLAGRTFFVSTVSTLLGLTGQNLQLSIALFCVTSLFSCYFLVREIKATFGLFPAFMGFILLFTFYMTIAGALLSEIEGFVLGGIACALLLNGTREKKVWPVWLGLLMLTLAMNARPGAYFIFPALILWSILYKNDAMLTKRFWLGCLIAIGIGFIINWSFNQWLAVKTNTNYANLPVLLLGLVSGGINPDIIVQQHPELNTWANSQIAVQTAYRLVFDTFRSNPAGLFVGITKSYLDYFGTNGAFSFMTGGNRIITLVMDALLIIGIMVALVNLKKPEKNIWGMAGLGVILTVPIINYVGVRAYAATLGVQVILVAMAIHSLFVWLKINPRIDQLPLKNYARDSMVYTVIILTIVIMGPIIIRLFSRPEVVKPISCPAGQVAVTIQWSEGSYIQLLPDYQYAASSVPLVRITDFRKGQLGYDNLPFYGEMKKMQENHYLINAYDINNGSAFWLVLDPSQVPGKNALLGVCGKYRASTHPGNTGVMDAISVTSLP